MNKKYTTTLGTPQPATVAISFFYEVSPSIILFKLMIKAEAAQLIREACWGNSSGTVAVTPEMGSSEGKASS